MDTQLDDIASFNHQRRNVMWLSCLLILICVVGANLDNITIFGIEPKHPKLIMWTLFVVLTYFVWRFYQVSQDPEIRARINGWYKESLEGRLRKKGRKIAHAKLLHDAQAEAKREGTEPSYGCIDVQIEITGGAATDKELRFPRANYIYNGTASWVDPKGGAYSIGRNGSKVGFDLSTAGRLWIKSKAVILVTFSRIAFTEYVLPYMLAVAAFGCVIWRYY